ncbi:S-type pyocin domain-containing protein [Pseudomonas sp. CMR5c]|uniref:S-type pyocin domain-containing protein n=1 Tax=Pseudomonas sp. CMR5c TaxID=658630 RepID=UPI0015A73943
MLYLDVPPRTLTWTPAALTGYSSTNLPIGPAPPPVYNGARITHVAGRIDTFSEVAYVHFDDCIMTFPVGTGFAPDYVIFNSPYGGSQR